MDLRFSVWAYVAAAPDEVYEAVADPDDGRLPFADVSYTLESPAGCR